MHVEIVYTHIITANSTGTSEKRAECFVIVNSFSALCNTIQIKTIWDDLFKILKFIKINKILFNIAFNIADYVHKHYNNRKIFVINYLSMCIQTSEDADYGCEIHERYINCDIKYTCRRNLLIVI